jgi:hypothetical protein
MNHDIGDGGWRMWLPMIICCALMIGAIVLLGLGAWPFR